MHKNDRKSFAPSAVITGTSRGIGRSVALKLLRAGYTVYGLSRTEGDIEHPEFHYVQCDLKKLSEIEEISEVLLRKISVINVLILNAGVGYFKPFTDLSASQIESTIHVNLLSSLLLCNAFIRKIYDSKGHILFISSITSIKISKFSHVYGATKAAINYFSKALFDEVRKQGVKVSHIIPDITDTSFYNDKFFAPDTSSSEHFIDPDALAELIISVIQFPQSSITELVIEPQMVRILKKKRE
jgi:short-subunit dehydrogenase